MKSSTVARGMLVLLAGGAFWFWGQQLLEDAPTSQRTAAEPAVPLVDVVDTIPQSRLLTLRAAGTITSARELEIRPQVGGRVETMHPEFEPGGRIPAGETILTIEAEEYRLALAAAEAEVAKAEATVALERGRRVVAREELAILRDSIEVDKRSQGLALRQPQLRQVRAELAAAQNALERARLDLARTRLSLPFDVVVLERTRVAGEVVAGRELIGRVAQADNYWLELRARPELIRQVRVRAGDQPGSKVTILQDGTGLEGEVIRLRADLATGSRLAGMIAAIPIPEGREAPLLGTYVEADVEAGWMESLIEIPRRALRDNRRIWVVDSDQTLRVRETQPVWESGDQIYLRGDVLAPGDQVVVSRVSGQIPGTRVRTRRIEVDADSAVASRP